MGDKKFPGESALEALFGAIKSSLSSKQNQTLSTTIAGSSTVEGALQALEQSSGGTDDYSELDNKPQINGVELSGNKTASDLGINIPTNLSDLNDDSTHRTVSDTEKSAWNGKADTADITNAINALDVASVGGTGKYISAISEADGKINATEETMDDAPTENSNAPVKSGGIKTAIDDSVSLKTATGNPITLTDAANANAEELSMTIEPIQSGSGDPSPTNVRPISGLTEGKVTRTGKNLLPLTVGGIKSANTSGTWDGNVYTVNGVSFAVNTDSDGNVISIVVSGTSNNPIDFYFYKGKIVISNNSILSTEVTRTIGFDEYIGTIAISTGYDSVDIPSGTYTNCALYIVSNIAMNNLTFKPMIILATETDPTFEPYTAANATITFGQTVYGGSVNFKTGEVTVTHGMADLGSLTWEYWSNNVFIANVTDKRSTKQDSIICDSYPTKDPDTSYIFADNCIFNLVGNETQRRYIYIADSSYSHDATGASALKMALSGKYAVYELATPTTLTLTPAELELLKGNNTITANGAEISIKYYPDNAIGALAGRVDDVQAQIANRVEIQNNAGFHNSIYRGKNLGTEVTQEQWNAISAGTFDDMYIGDYWTIGGVNYRIAHFDYWLNTGDTNCTTHHVVLVPDTNLYTAKMNDSNVTTGAYVGSKMYTENLATAKSTINNAFGASHILNHREYLANAMKATADPTYESTGAWYDSTVELMNERMVYGADVFHNVEVNGAIPLNYTIDKSQLALFALEPSRICLRASWWLRCAVSAAHFALVYTNGVAAYTDAGNALGVRPAFGIKA